MKIEVNIWKNVDVVKLISERVTFENVTQFNSFMSDNENFSNTNILIDFMDCNYIDSTFLGSLIRNYIALKKQNITVKVVCNEKINFILDEVSHLGSVIDVFLQVDEALKSFE